MYCVIKNVQTNFLDVYIFIYQYFGLAIEQQINIYWNLAAGKHLLSVEPIPR